MWALSIPEEGEKQWVSIERRERSAKVSVNNGQYQCLDQKKILSQLPCSHSSTQTDNRMNFTSMFKYASGQESMKGLTSEIVIEQFGITLFYLAGW